MKSYWVKILAPEVWGKIFYINNQGSAVSYRC